MQTNPPPQHASSCAYKSALLLDDDPYSLNLARAALESLGITEIATAEDGDTGIRLFDKMATKPDLILCDLYMPSMDGIEVLNELGSRNYKGGVILVTAGDMSMLQIAQTVALGDKRLNLLAALAKPLTAASISDSLGLAEPV